MAMIGEKDKQEIIKEFQRHEKDHGSSEVQISVLTERINHLVEHLKQHKKDHHTRRGLLILVSKRKRLLEYFSKQDPKSFLALAKKLKIKTK